MWCERSGFSMKKHTVDMTKGSIIRHIILFAIPIMISGVLQSLYNAADMIIVGKFAGSRSMAAVGSTSSAINLMINIFIGLSSATNVIVARKFGAGNKEGVFKSVHTAISLCLIGGIFLAVMGALLSKQVLLLMKSPVDVIDLSALYMRVYFIGIPAVLLYNFGSAILRAVGDSQRPTFYLMLSGVINVLLNLVFVIFFKMDVVGVALATVISQLVSAILVLRCLINTDECYKLEFKKLRIFGSELKETLLLGIPAGIQGSLFSLSNVIIQSSINSVGSVAMAGNSAASSIENIVYIAMNAFFHATLTFTGQNYGAHDFKRMRKGVGVSFLVVSVAGVLLSALVIGFRELFVSVYTDSPEVSEIACQRILYICAGYVICGMMEVGSGALRGIGVATRGMLICVAGVCGVRVLTTLMFAPYNEVSDLIPLYLSYPVSWTITGTLLLSTFFIIVKKREKRWLQEKKEYTA